jgi:hypothetical protein
MLITFGLVTLGLILIRATTIQDAWFYISKIASSSLFTFPSIDVRNIEALIWTIVFLFIEWMGRKDQYAIAMLGLNWNGFLRHSMYIVLGLIISYYALTTGRGETFIYFQF